MEKVPMQGNPRQFWILDSSALWITDSRYLFPVCVSGSWILDFNR